MVMGEVEQRTAPSRLASVYGRLTKQFNSNFDSLRGNAAFSIAETRLMERSLASILYLQ